MAKFLTFIYFVSITFLIFHFNFITADPNLSFAFQSFRKDQNFKSNIALYGDAKIVDDGSSIQLAHSVIFSRGRVMYRRLIKLVEGNPGKMVSLSTYFSFLMSPDDGYGLAFIMVPSAFNASAFDNGPLETKKSDLKIVSVEFGSFKDAKHGELMENHVGIDLGGFVSAKVRNASSVTAVFENKTRLHSWIDYEASTKRLEVRLGQSGGVKPIEPMLTYPVDLSRMWNDDEVLVGLSSSNGNSSGTCSIYSWNLSLRSIPQWMHSEPLDPRAFVKNEKSLVTQKRRYCLLRVLAAMIFGTTCGALGAFVVLYFWTIFGNRRPVVVVPEEFSEDFEYKKVKVVVDKVAEDGKQ
ncbi:hypothetical protein K2173_000017 [Erythroxylum novogranatense]|uniref:Legume lectin domain-containing protein n=1 Tax=Erythroxylum novogranatense TaxID=1862640 RepID=A0AAV8SNI4_9ROSI|nr:hypothetical protein K2173_000017 [Erythroxylum novogranatense]